MKGHIFAETPEWPDREQHYLYAKALGAEIYRVELRDEKDSPVAVGLVDLELMLTLMRYYRTQIYDRDGKLIAFGGGS